MPIINTPEYESKLNNCFQVRITTPTGLHVLDNILSFYKPTNATTYEIFIDNTSHGNVNISGTGIYRYLFNEIIPISDTESKQYNINFVSNGISYSSIRIYGKNNESSGKFAIYYDDTKVYEENDGHSSYWLNQIYRTIEFTNALTSVKNYLNLNAVLEPEVLSYDISTLATWNSLTNGTHVLYIIGKCTDYIDSLPSDSISFGKNVEFIAGQIYGPFTCVRVVDGDTIVANINGADSKIRMIGVNTPESVASSSYGTENCEEGIIASNYTKAQLNNAQIYLEFDTDIYDRYNRYLCYIYLDSVGETIYNKQLISLGYGESKYYSPNGAHRAELDAAQTIARTNEIGFWSYGFYPTKLTPPVVTITYGESSNEYDYIIWEHNPYAGSYDIKKDGQVIDTYVPPENITTIEYDIYTPTNTDGTYRINVVAKPLRTTHETSTNSNNIQYSRVSI